MKGVANTNLFFFYKLVNGIVPSQLSNLVPQTVGSATGRTSLRNSANISSIPSRTSLYSNSFLPSTLRDWNSLSLDVRNSDSVLSFRNSLNRDRPSQEPLFYIGDRKLQVLHTRLRTSCSSLNHHLFAKNLVESPCCSCGATETTHHYLLECPNYAACRQFLFDSVSGVCRPDVNTFLHGSNTLTPAMNELVFHSVQRFIGDSKRFDA